MEAAKLRKYVSTQIYKSTNHIIPRMAFPFTDDAETFPLAEDHARKFLEYVREEDPEKIASFPNHTRERPAHERYPGAWRLERLRALKREWDPKGVFPQDFS